MCFIQFRGCNTIAPLQGFSLYKEAFISHNELFPQFRRGEQVGNGITHRVIHFPLWAISVVPLATSVMGNSASDLRALADVSLTRERASMIYFKRWRSSCTHGEPFSRLQSRYGGKLQYARKNNLSIFRLKRFFFFRKGYGRNIRGRKIMKNLLKKCSDGGIVCLVYVELCWISYK